MIEKFLSCAVLCAFYINDIWPKIGVHQRQAASHRVQQGRGRQGGQGGGQAVD